MNAEKRGKAKRVRHVPRRARALTFRAACARAKRKPHVRVDEPLRRMNVERVVQAPRDPDEVGDRDADAGVPQDGDGDGDGAPTRRDSHGSSLRQLSCLTRSRAGPRDSCRIPRRPDRRAPRRSRVDHDAAVIAPRERRDAHRDGRRAPRAPRTRSSAAASSRRSACWRAVAWRRAIAFDHLAPLAGPQVRGARRRVRRDRPLQRVRPVAGERLRRGPRLRLEARPVPPPRLHLDRTQATVELPAGV